ncbi:hypothetical protein H4S06_004932 [Coemansia sp. BCRC 34490]|nr:hypothetical protein H4S06_004932 [Coemansia sp. BCRC 34490]
MEASNPWSQVENYLNTTEPGGPDIDTGASDPVFCCVLDSFEAPTKAESDNRFATILSIVGRKNDTVLGSIRRQAMKQSAAWKNSTVVSLAESSSSKDAEDEDQNRWAVSALRSLSETEPPDFSSALKIWQLPHTALARLCQEHLSINSFSGPALAAFIDSAVSSPNVSLENQTLLLRQAASSILFADGEEAIPSIVQTQIIALLQAYPQVMARGLLLPLLEDPKHLLPPVTAMSVKAIKTDLPASAAEIVGNEVTSIASKSPSDVSDNFLQVMEAVVSAMSAPSMAEKQLLVKWSKSWADMFRQIVPLNCESKKLSALVLHFVNRFGAKLDVSDLDGLATSVNLIRTPLKAAIAGTISRKRKAKQS